LALLARFILEVVPEMYPLSEQGNRSNKRQIQGSEAQGLPCVAALMSQDFTCGCSTCCSGSRTPNRIPDSAAADHNRIQSRCRPESLFVQDLLREIRAHHNDFRGPGDTRASPQGPATCRISAIGGKDVDTSPFQFGKRLAVNLEARRTAEPAQPASDKHIHLFANSQALARQAPAGPSPQPNTRLRNSRARSVRGLSIT